MDIFIRKPNEALEKVYALRRDLMLGIISFEQFFSAVRAMKVDKSDSDTMTLEFNLVLFSKSGSDTLEFASINDEAVMDKMDKEALKEFSYLSLIKKNKTADNLIEVLEETIRHFRERSEEDRIMFGDL